MLNSFNIIFKWCCIDINLNNLLLAETKKLDIVGFIFQFLILDNLYMIDRIINEYFNSETLLSNLAWYNEPAQWAIDREQNIFSLYSDADTDFWQRTHYGFEADSGHFLRLT